MNKSFAWGLLILILWTAFLLRTYRLLDFPLHGDEVDEGDIALEILQGKFALFYPQNEGNEPLLQLTMAPFFAILGNSVIANRFPSMAWSILFVALMYTYARTLFRSRRVGVMAAGLAAILWYPIIFGRLGLREISQPVIMTPALIGLVIAFRDASSKRAWQAAILGGIFAGLTSYTFLSGRGFPIAVILFLIYLAIFQRERFHNRWRLLVIYLAIDLALTIPLLVFLQLHPELDFHTRDLAAQSWLMQGNWDGLVRDVTATLGMFTFSGDLNWVRNIPGRPVFPGIEGILFYVGIVLCAWRWRKPEFVLQLIIVAVFLTPNLITQDPPRFTRSIGILPGLMVIPTLPIETGWTSIERWFTLNWQRVTYAALVALLGISILGRTATDMFQNWIDNPGIYWMTLAFYDSAGKYINQSPDSTPLNYVMDVYTNWRKHNIQRVIQRSDVAVRFSIWNAFVFPNDARGNRFAFQILGSPALPLLLTFLDLESPIYIDPRIEPEGRRLLHVYFVPRARLDEHLARAKNNVVVNPQTSSTVTLPLEISGVMEFEGIEILNPEAHAGDELAVLTYWQILTRPPNLAVFVHLVNSQQIVSQFDGWGAINDDLEPGDLVVQLHTIPLPDNLPADEYRLEVGAYTRDDLQRLMWNTGTDYVWLEW